MFSVSFNYTTPLYYMSKTEHFNSGSLLYNFVYRCIFKLAILNILGVTSKTLV
jgi:hypothetical protein